MILLVLSGAPTVRAQEAGRIAFDRFSLANGLEVVLAPDHTSQVVAVSIWYRAGSRNEPPAKAGLARLFERLMFTGSASVPAGGHGAIVEDAGGRLTAAVDEEFSRYSETLPSNRLNLGLWLEADRMRSLAINDTTVAQSQRGLLADLDARVGQEAYTGAILEAIASIYDSTTCPGYAHPSIGRAGSILTLTTSDARDFFHKYYVPNNARLVVTGDFDPAATRPQITTLFGDIPRGPETPDVACGTTDTSGARSSTVTDRLAARAAVGRFYRIPAHTDADSPALELLGIVLSQGPGSRLTAQLVRETRTADATQGGLLTDRSGPGVFGLFGVAAEGVSADSVGAELAAQAAWAGGPGLTEADLDRARNIYLATAVSGRERPVDVAEALHHAAAIHGAIESVNTEVAKVMAVSLADLRRVAAAWLAPSRAVTVIVMPGAAS
ncbi:MAG: pitrilysin family protein [Gemmatimonadota bacterium]